jgi:hypothetical protein
MKTLNKATDSKWILLVLAGLCNLPAVAMAEGMRYALWT